MKRSWWKKSLLGLAAGIISISTALPLAHAEKYTIKEGDTFWKLSRTYQLTLDSVLAANKGVNPLNLQEGQVVELPLAIKKATVSVQTLSTLQGSETQNIVVTTTGEKRTYDKKLTVKASAYTAAPDENGGWEGLDYLGNHLKVGTVAVDPKVIPLGSTLYITGYDFDGLPEGGMLAKATDIGSAIKGNRVDLFVPVSKQKAYTFGYQNITVYVLD